ncbi:MAG: endolytic transglycosylase MltG [Clostridia bacterium]|nr:endolytic transglycosylase MltG [Clostridia bacterium]
MDYKQYIKLGIVIFVAIIIGVIGIYIKNIDTVKLKNPVEFEIPSGAYTKQIAKILHENKLIKNEFAFVEYIKKKDAANKLRPGVYNFEPGVITFETILQNLLKGKDFEPSINVTIPEGYTVTQIAELLEEKELTTKDSFLETAKNIELPYDYIDEPGDFRRLEGFLFPETYNLLLSYTDEDIIKVMVKEFDTVFTEEYRLRAEELNMSIKDIVTIASLIEREAKVEKERPMISGVIYNRLKIDMLLQIDATIQYLLDKQKERLLYVDLEVDSPYNTYLYKGLPPTPIASPGKSCIEAALFPTEHDYYYYRTKKEGNGEHYFSKTFEEHVAYGNK